MKKNLILIVDDDRDMGTLLCHYLKEREDSTVQYFEDASKALSFINQNPDAQNKYIITDIMMPVMDGLEFIEVSKHLDDSYHVCVLSNAASEKIIEECFSIGIDDYILKNRTIDEILCKIDAIIDNDSETTPEFIELYQVSDVINAFKIKNKVGKKLIIETKGELPLESLVKIPDDNGNKYLYRVEKCDLVDNGALITCRGIKGAA